MTYKTPTCKTSLASSASDLTSSDLAASLTPKEQLDRLRQSIDNIDAALIHMLAERFRCTEAVGRLKAQNALPATDTTREKEQIARLRRLAGASGLSPDFAEKLFNFIVQDVINRHREIARNEAAPPRPSV